MLLPAPSCGPNSSLAAPSAHPAQLYATSGDGMTEASHSVHVFAACCRKQNVDKQT